jgi:hypothetical protein
VPLRQSFSIEREVLLKRIHKLAVLWIESQSRKRQWLGSRQRRGHRPSVNDRNRGRLNNSRNRGGSRNAATTLDAAAKRVLSSLRPRDLLADADTMKLVELGKAVSHLFLRLVSL